MWIRRFAVFLGALILYLICLDRGASLWDCPEYILIAWRLEIGHPPGNPTWQLIANVASRLGGSAESAAIIINAMSALAMALASVLLSEIIWLLLRGSLLRGRGRKFLVAANLCAACGALCYAWCDSAIFSAVEAEVYALSAFFTALMLLLALRWAVKRSRGNIAGSRRLLILMAYIAGLGVGVHELNFLILPAVALIFFYGIRKYPVPEEGRRKLFYVRSDGAPTALWSLLLFIIGTTTYLILPIRAAANPPINQGDPSTFDRLRRYYAREQYGSSPLLYGPTPYSEPLLLEQTDSLTGEYDYSRYFIYEDDRGLRKQLFPDELNMWFPRMKSRHEADKEFYAAWAGMIPEDMVAVEASVVADSTGRQMGRYNPETGRREKRQTFRPTYMQQLRYFLGYQVGYMYLRYLMWNFSGRQNNIHSTGGADTGNFITGFTVIDDAMLGPQSKLPRSMREGNVGYNRYFLIPLFMGLAGIVALIASGRRGRRVCAVVALFFLFTGLLIVVYLNQDPGEPRERDYSFLGSYMAYAIWIACGMAAFVKLLMRLPARSKTVRSILQVAAVLICIGVPLQMLSQTCDDHNRSHRPGAKEKAEKLLDGIEPGAIVMVNGDNWIFPLWYAQEVLGMRHDVTVVAIPYLVTDWYKRQLLRPGEGAPPVKIDAETVEGRASVDAVIDNIILMNAGERPIYRTDGKGVLIKVEDE